MKKVVSLAQAKLDPARDPKELLDTFEKIREQILDGSCTGFTAVLEHHSGNYTTIGTGINDSRKAAGTLMEMAVLRLGFRYREGIE